MISFTPSRREIVENCRTTPRQDQGGPLIGPVYQPDRYELVETLERLPGDDLKAIVQNANHDSLIRQRSGILCLATAIPLWVAGAVGLCMGATGLAIPALALGSLGFFRGIGQQQLAQHDTRLVHDLEGYSRQVNAGGLSDHG